MKAGKFVAAAACAALVLCLGGCGGQSADSGSSSGSSDQPVKAQDISPTDEVTNPTVKTGYSVIGDVVNVGAVVENPNDNAVFPQFVVTLTAYDEAGKALGNEACDLGTLLGGEEFGYGVTIDIPDGSTVASVDATWTTQEASMSDNANVFVADEPTDNNGVLTGTFFNETEDTFGRVIVGAIAYDASGSIIGGGVEHLADVAGGTSDYEVIVPAEGANYSVFVHGVVA